MITLLPRPWAGEGQLCERQTKELAEQHLMHLADNLRRTPKLRPYPGVRLDCEFMYHDFSTKGKVMGVARIVFGYLASIDYHFEATLTPEGWVLTKFQLVGGA